MQKLKISILLFLALMLVSCASSLRPYVSARTVLNNYWEAYLDYRDSLPEGPEKEALRRRFADSGTNSYFTAAAAALDAWKAAIGTEDEFIKREIYYDSFNRIMALLFKEGIINVEGFLEVKGGCLKCLST